MYNTTYTYKIRRQEWLKKKNRQNIPAIIITVFAALLAAAAVIFMIIIVSDDGNDTDPSATSTTEPQGFVPDADLKSEVEQAAYELLPENYKVYQYLTHGMSYKEEPYGNLPEDGFYTCVNDDFPTFEAFSEYVRSIYTAETAEKLLNDPFGNGPVYGDDNGELGLSAEFEPSAEEGLSWADVHFVCEMISETVCDITVTLKDADGKDVDKVVRMQLDNGSWRLADMIG